MNVDITLSEDRANVFGDLWAIANYCLSTSTVRRAIDHGSLNT